jgi:hypothetical protein
MPLSRYRGPKIARHAALRHMTGYDLENQSRGRDRSSCRSMIAVAGAGIGESSSLKPRRNGLAVPSTIWPWICLRELMRSAHCRSMRRWTLNGYIALIRSTSLTRSYARREYVFDGFAFPLCTKSWRLGRFHAMRKNAGRTGRRAFADRGRLGAAR